MNNIITLKRIIADLVIDNWQFNEEIKDKNASLTLQGDLNRNAAKALGKPFKGEGSSWHDIPEQIIRLRKEHAQLSKRPTITEHEDLKASRRRINKRHAETLGHVRRLESILRSQGKLK